MENQLEIIQTKDYFLCIDNPEEGANSKVKFYNNKVDDNNIFKSESFMGNMVTYYLIKGIKENYVSCHKIIAYLPLNSNVLGGVPLLPKFEDVVEKLGRERAIERRWHPDRMETKRVANEIIQAVKFGYRAATKVYTEEDMRTAIERARDEIGDSPYDLEYKFSSDDIIKSFESSKIPIYFIAELLNSNEVEKYIEDGSRDGTIIWKPEYIIKNNTLIGTYKF